MAGLDDWLKRKVPGNAQVKVFAGVGVVLLASGYHVFGKREGGKQGEHYFSQERPEAIVKAQEEERKKYREQRKAKHQALQQQQEQQQS